MLNRVIRLALVSAFAAAVAGYGVAHAQDNPCGDSAANPCGDPAVGGTGKVLPEGKLAVNIGVLASLIADAIAKPISITPDVRYGVAPKLDVGLYHSPVGITGFWHGLGGGLCVTGTDGKCPKFYNGPVGVLANYALAEGRLSLAANGGLVLNALDPMALGIKAGVNGMYMASPKLSITFSPNLILGLTERDTVLQEIINVPISVGLAVSPRLHAGVQTGITGPLDGFGDTFQVPVNVGARFMVNDKIGVAGSFNFFNLAGRNANADLRSLSLYLMWHN